MVNCTDLVNDVIRNDIVVDDRIAETAQLGLHSTAVGSSAKHEVPMRVTVLVGVRVIIVQYKLGLDASVGDALAADKVHCLKNVQRPAMDDMLGDKVLAN